MEENIQDEAWMEIGQDPNYGAEQKGGAYLKRVSESSMNK